MFHAIASKRLKNFEHEIELKFIFFDFLFLKEGL